MAPDNDANDYDLQADMDSLHIMPLCVVPFSTRALKHARLLKNSRLESVVEMFHGPRTGSGQVDPMQLAPILDWAGKDGEEDLRVVCALSKLNSYDVYGLRVELRNLNIPLVDAEALHLSEAKKAELHGYMRTFTEPLLKQIYGDAETIAGDIDSLIGLFSQPDREKALDNIRLMARRLNVDVAEIPRFLEDYGDIYLSLAYYRQCLDRLLPIVQSFSDMAKELRHNEIVADEPLRSTCDEIVDRLDYITCSLLARFDCFDKQSSRMWQNISAASFRNLRQLVMGHHATVGGVLCSLQCKMDLWQLECGGTHAGPVRQAAFVMSHMRNGMDKIKKIEDSAPEINAA